jgi:predicted transcriptional regulator
MRQRLGELELAIMEYVWRRTEPVTVGEAHRHLLKSRPLAYTTTMTVMGRLVEKEFLERDESHRPYRYWAALLREDFSAELMLDVLREFGDRRAALTRFVERIGRRDAELLRGLLDEGD